MKKIAALIVTFNSEKHLIRAISDLLVQSPPPEQIILVDTGSSCKEYLNKYRDSKLFTLIEAPEGAGFCVGNNLGWLQVRSDIDFLVIINPDTYLSKDFFQKALIEMKQRPGCGALSGILKGYDVTSGTPTGRYDSTGIFQKWYGKWYDRSHGQPIESKQFIKPEKVQALCGALMFCRKRAINDVLINQNEIFDSSFFMYKEDIDLSLRLQKKGWSLWMIPSLTAYHCRGWSVKRREVKKQLRLISAKNDLKIAKRQKNWIAYSYSAIKYLAVKLLNC